MPRARTLAGLAAAATVAAAASLPPANNALGPVYPVAEHSMLAFIEQAASDYAASDRAREDLLRAQSSAAAYVAQPPAGIAPARAARDSLRMFDPTIALAQDVRDASGRVIVPAGTQINPLEHGRLDALIVLFDGNDPAQSAFAATIAQGPRKAYPILVAGSPAAFARRAGVRAYFDQNAAIAKRLQIDEFPAVVRQQGTALRIDTRSLAPAGK